MTRPTVMDKDRLAAFVDGEMSPEESAAVVMHLADNPQDQAYVDDLMAANAALAQAFAVPLEEPMPPALRSLLLGEAEEAKVLPFRARIPNRLVQWGGLATAAALAAGVVVAVYLPSGAISGLTPGPLAESSPLQQVLAALPAGTVQVMEDGAEVMILSSVPTPEGFCREIEVIRPAEDQLEVALACTEGSGWALEVVIAEGLADAAGADGFGTASGEEAQSFTPFLDRIGAGQFLSPEDEAAVIARGWAK